MPLHVKLNIIAIVLFTFSLAIAILAIGSGGWVFMNFLLVAINICGIVWNAIQIDKYLDKENKDG